MRVRAMSIGGATCLAAVLVVALALPGPGAGRPLDASRHAATRPVCLPTNHTGSSEGFVPCDRLLETLSVPAGSTGVTTETDFDPDIPYRFVFGGVVHLQGPHAGDNQFDVDAIYCFGGSNSFCQSPISRGAMGLHARGGSLGGDANVSDNWWHFPAIPPYSSTHSYESTAYTPPLVLSGHITFFDNPQTSYQESGAWTIKIYGVSTETVKFGVSMSIHHRANAHVYVNTTSSGVGQLVVPIPKGKELVSSTSAKGTLHFSKLKIGGPEVIDIDQLTLRVKSGRFRAANSEDGDLVVADVVVTKSAVKACKIGATGTAHFYDGSKVSDKDQFGLSIHGCDISELYTAGNNHAKLAVVVDPQTPQPPG